MSFVRLQRNRQGAVGLLHLLRGRLRRRVIRDRRGHDHRILVGRAGHHRGVHLGGAAHLDHARRRAARVRCVGPLTRVTAAPRRKRLGRQCVTHAAARAVADEADRIDIFKGRSRGDQHACARPGCRRADVFARKQLLAPHATTSSGSARRPLPIQPHAR